MNQTENEQSRKAEVTGSTKLKTYVLTVSEYFPVTHSKRGTPTGFAFAIEIGCKKHTIRANYSLWKKRLDEVMDDKAILSVRYWSGKPYNSKQVTVKNFVATDGVGIEKIEFLKDGDGVPALKYPTVNNRQNPPIWLIAENDWLPFIDFKEWFKNYDLTQPMAIIHFSRFRYCQ